MALSGAVNPRPNYLPPAVYHTGGGGAGGGCEHTYLGDVRMLIGCPRQAGQSLRQEEVCELLLVGDEGVAMQGHKGLLLPGVDVVTLVQLFVELLSGVIYRRHDNTRRTGGGGVGNTQTHRYT